MFQSLFPESSTAASPVSVQFLSLEGAVYKEINWDSAPVLQGEISLISVQALMIFNNMLCPKPVYM